MKKFKLSKKFQNRNRMLRNQLSSLILFEQITTTAPKAKALKSQMQSLITKLKKFDDEVSAKRYISSVLYGGAKEKAFDYRNSFKEVKLYKMQARFGDGAETVLVKLVKEEVAKKTLKEEKKVSSRK